MFNSGYATTKQPAKIFKKNFPPEKSSPQEHTVIKTCFGDVKAPLVINALLSHPAVKRMQNIDQSGGLVYFGYAPHFTRYEHSRDVWALLHILFRKQGKPENKTMKEEISALLHDISHTTFSHIADHIFGIPQQMRSYQDLIHLGFLEKSGVFFFLKFFIADISLDDLDPEKNSVLEKDLPCICADRIQYILYTSYLFGNISEQEMKEILDDLSFEDGVWFFKTQHIAEKFSEQSLFLTKDFWGAPWNGVFYEVFSKMLKILLKSGEVTHDMIHEKSDKEILEVIQSSVNPNVKRLFNVCLNLEKHYRVVKKEEPYTFVWHPKFRGVNPYVFVKDKKMRLTEISPAYKEKFQAVKQYCEGGMYIQVYEYEESGQFYPIRRFHTPGALRKESTN